MVLRQKPKMSKQKTLHHRPKKKWSQDKKIFVLEQSDRYTKKETRTVRPKRVELFFFLPKNKFMCLETKCSGHKAKKSYLESLITM